MLWSQTKGIVWCTLRKQITVSYAVATHQLIPADSGVSVAATTAGSQITGPVKAQ